MIQIEYNKYKWEVIQMLTKINKSALMELNMQIIELKLVCINHWLSERWIHLWRKWLKASLVCSDVSLGYTSWLLLKDLCVLLGINSSRDCLNCMYAWDYWVTYKQVAALSMSSLGVSVNISIVLSSLGSCYSSCSSFLTEL